jgi:hypothetical protein
MHARKKNITRDTLRFFEIALFFLVSIMGYSILAKTSGHNTKSKNKRDAAGIQKSSEAAKYERGLFFETCIKRLSVPAGNTRNHQTITDVHHLNLKFSPSVHFIASPSDILLSSIDSCSRPPLPYNLFQQNPVLLT